MNCVSLSEIKFTGTPNLQMTFFHIKHRTFNTYITVIDSAPIHLVKELELAGYHRKGS